MLDTAAEKLAASAFDQIGYSLYAFLSTGTPLAAFLGASALI